MNFKIKWFNVSMQAGASRRASRRATVDPICRPWHGPLAARRPQQPQDPGFLRWHIRRAAALPQLPLQVTKYFRTSVLSLSGPNGPLTTTAKETRQHRNNQATKEGEHGHDTNRWRGKAIRFGCPPLDSIRCFVQNSIYGHDTEGVHLLEGFLFPSPPSWTHGRCVV
jgi:hypothetical protein